MSSVLVRIALVAAAALLPAAIAAAQVTLYAAAKGEIEGSAPSTLYTLDPTDASATAIGPIEGPDPEGGGTLQYESVSGLAFLRDGRLVGAASGDALLEAGRESVLIEVDPGSGAATFIGVIDDDVAGLCGRITDLAVDPVTGALYGIGKRCSDDEDRLYEIDPSTGAGTAIGVIDGQTRMGNGLAFEPARVRLFATRTRIRPVTDHPDRLRLELQRLDPETGDGAIVSQLDWGTLGGLDFHPLDGVLYGVGVEQEEVEPDVFVLVPVLVTVDTVNARPTRVGVTTLDGEDLFGVEAIAFLAPGGCPASASIGCFGPGKSRISYKTSGGKLKWKWSRGGFTAESLGDPTLDTGYRFCLYDTEGAGPVLETGAELPPGEGWKATKRGFRYKQKGGEPDGIRSLVFKSGAGKARLKLKGRGVAAPMLPLEQSPSVVVEVQSTAGSCWQGLYGEPARKNDAERFEDAFP